MYHVALKLRAVNMCYLAFLWLRSPGIGYLDAQLQGLTGLQPRRQSLFGYHLKAWLRKERLPSSYMIVGKIPFPGDCWTENCVSSPLVSWSSSSFPCHVSFNMVTRFLQASLRESFADKTEMTIFCNLIMEVTSNHRCNIPSSSPYSFD